MFWLKIFIVSFKNFDVKFKSIVVGNKWKFTNKTFFPHHVVFPLKMKKFNFKASKNWILNTQKSIHDFDSVKCHFLHAALVTRQRPLITMSLHKHNFHITCMNGYKESSKEERKQKTAKRAMNWSRKHFYANKMTAVIFFSCLPFIFSILPFYFSSMWICHLIKTYKHDHMNEK